MYTTVKIGNQIWTVENLKTSKYNDGTPIPHVKDKDAWQTLTTGAYCYYDNIAANGKKYGALYNWYAVNTGKLTPEGWRMPTDRDWTTLENYLGGKKVAGGKMKEAGTLHWKSPNTGASNSSGFSALPRGYRFNASFAFQSSNCYGWSATENDASNAWCRNLFHGSETLGRGSIGKQNGFSVRLIGN